jgi:hypothetical protein
MYSNNTISEKWTFFFISHIPAIKNKILFHCWKLLLQLFLPQGILWFDIPDSGHKKLKHVVYNILSNHTTELLLMVYSVISNKS